MKMFRIGISVGRNGLNIEGHLQAGYSSKTVNNYKPDENALTNDEPNDSIQNVEEWSDSFFSRVNMDEYVSSVYYDP